MKLNFLLLGMAFAAFVAGQCQAAKQVQAAPPKQSVVSPVQADLEAMVASPREWETFDWSRAAAHRASKDQRWQQRKEVKIEANGKAIKAERKVRLPSGEWQTLSWVDAVNGEQPVMFTMSRDVAYEDCQAAAAALGKDLDPGVSNDNSLRTYTSPENYVTSLLTTTQWIVGSTVIEASCMGFTSTVKMAKEKADTALLNVMIRPLASTRALAKNFTLRCSRKLKLWAGGEERPIDDMAILVSPNEPYMIRSPNLVSQNAPDEKVAIDDVSIRFVTHTKVGKVSYFIDRVTGRMSADVKDNGNQVATVTGACEKTNSATLF